MSFEEDSPSRFSDPLSQNSDVSVQTQAVRPNSPLGARPVPKDDQGNYTLPVDIGIITVINLGVIEYNNPNFHSENYIWPIGYTVKRYYLSTIHSDKDTCYTLTIADNNGSPSFRIIADDNPKLIVGNTCTKAWLEVLKSAFKIRGRNTNTTANGPDYFGLSDPTITNMIQNLPNARLCKNYRWT